jgi:hypothetical protein
MFTDEMLRLIAEEREREIQAHLRARGLLGPRRSRVRWRHRSSQPAVRLHVEDRLR